MLGRRGGLQGGVRGGGLSRPQGLSDHRRHTHAHTQSFSFFPPSFKGATQICIILRVLNFQPVSSSYFNKRTNQCWFRSSTAALLQLWHSISRFHPLSLSGFSPRMTRQEEKKRRMKTGEEEYDGGLDDYRRGKKEECNRKEGRRRRKKRTCKRGSEGSGRKRNWWLMDGAEVQSWEQVIKSDSRV